MELERDREYKKTLSKLRKRYKDVDEDKKHLVDNILEDYAFLYVDNLILKEMIKESGSVIMLNGVPRKSEAAMQYQRNSNSMNMLTRTLLVITKAQNNDDDDPLGNFIKENKK